MMKNAHIQLKTLDSSCHMYCQKRFKSLNVEYLIDRVREKLISDGQYKKKDQQGSNHQLGKFSLQEGCFTFPFATFMFYFAVIIEGPEIVTASSVTSDVQHSFQKVRVIFFPVEFLLDTDFLVSSLHMFKILV